ncbi:MAG TPA: glycine--tRNA ligase subunit beta [Burkholderiales bacterium]|nr:glycine--tRNA ligase subunit beta [Burkholderiales bacterium]
MSMPLLVELFTEELPPKALKRLGEAFGDGILNGLIKAQLKTPDPKKKVFATPRRLAVLIPDVLSKAPDRGESKKLMPSKVAFGADGKPSAALSKRMEKEGASVDQLERKLDGDAEYVFLNQKLSGLTLVAGLQLALEDTIANLPIPKVMSYQLADGQTTVQFVRPVHSLMALHGDKVADISALGLKAGRITHGHRFQGVRDISVATADAYEEALAAHGKVMASLDARRAEIDKQLREKAAALKASLGPEEDVAPLLDEVTALVEYPTVYAGEFEREFLAVPQECLILTMRANQKYFPLFDKAGKLTNKFLIVSNMELKEPKNIVEGNQRVVRPRLADARFFFETDKKTKLADRVPQLANRVHHNKLGSELIRVERVRKLAAAIADLIGADPKLTDRAALLAKADLVTSMVGEFPDLQGTMGRYYALADDEDARVADAIEQHYRPRFAGDALPENDIAIALALADKLETLAGMFGIDQRPTGDKDPYALRRHALGVVRILIEKKVNVGIRPLIDLAIGVMPVHAKSDWLQIVEFILDRARSYFSEQGYASTAIEAVLRPFGSVSWLHTLPEIVAEASRFAATEEGRILAEANKRITNILKKSGYEVPFGLSPDDLKEKPKTELFKDNAEFVFWNALQKIGAESLELKKKQRFAESLRVLSQLGIPTKSFFDDVMVNAEEPDVRNNRITLLQHARAYMNQVADLSLMAA